MPDYEWSASAHRYREKASGKFLAEKTVRAYRNDFLDAQKSTVEDLAARLSDQKLSLSAWESAMREHVKSVFVAEAALGRGGRNAMTQSGWGHVGAALKEQYGFLRGFAEEIGRGTLSEAQIVARGQMYVGASVQAFERGKAASYGDLSLDQYPGDGQSVCLSQCRCFITVSETDTQWKVTWHTAGSGETCADCRAQASAWNPLVIEKSDKRAQMLVARLAGLNGRRLHAATAGVVH